MKSNKIIILGSGPAGCTAAIYLARAGLKPIIISGPLRGGQLTQTSAIENWPGEESISGFDLMEKLIKHAESLGTEFISDSITECDLSKKPFALKGNSESYECDSLIIATGATPKWLGLKSEELLKGSGVSACATCDGFFYRDQETAVIGGGNTALSDALYLSDIAKHVYLIHRRQEFRAEETLISRVKEKIAENKIIPILDAQVSEILGDITSGVTGITVKQKNGESKKIDVSGVFVAIGHTPVTNLFEGQIEMDNGIIVTHRNPKALSQTSVEGVFAAGDVQDHIYRQAITSAGTGCMAAQDAIKYLKG